MTKRLFKFDTLAEYDAVKDTLEKPYVAIIKENNGIQYNTDVVTGSNANDSANFMNITWAELKALRDSKALTIGTYYRITDYVTTTIQENTKSAGNKFDIIVLALDDHTLAEEAWASASEFNIEDYKEAYSSTWGERMIYLGTYDYNGKTYHLYESESQNLQMLVEFTESFHFIPSNGYYPYQSSPSWARDNFDNNEWGEWQEGKEYGEIFELTVNPYVYYFEDRGANLSAWKVRYCLDNDAERFAWADTENGKGVIYRMIDEYNNDLPYDFKNIMYVDLRKTKINAEANYYGTWWKGELVRNVSADKQTGSNSFRYAWVLTNVNGPSSSGVWYTDSESITSVDTIFYTYDGNDFLASETIRITNLAIGQMQYTFGNALAPDSVLSEFVDYTISIGGGCCNNIIKPMFYTGTNKQELNVILFGNGCQYNSFGDYCSHNTFGQCCSHNTFGQCCSYNTFGQCCSHNTFGSYFESNSFGDYCNSNNFEDYCRNNTFGKNCSYNTFGNYFVSNSFGDYCNSNNFENSCQYNSFGDYCSYNTFGDGSRNNVLKVYYRYITFGEGVQGVTLQNETEGDSENQVQNYRVANGTHKSSSQLVVDVVRGKACETTIALDSDGNIKVYCAADFDKQIENSIISVINTEV